MMQRETAWRIFAEEYNSSKEEIIATEEKTPSYVLTPLGAKINRVFFIGVLTDKQNIGEGNIIRARISDPTGVFFIMAGEKYQPEQFRVLSELKVPSFVAVIGKARTYQPEENVFYVSVRPELVKEVSAEDRNFWILETAKNLQKRLSAMKEAMKIEKPTIEKLMALNIEKSIAEGIVLAIEKYKEIDLAKFEAMLYDSLKYLIPEEIAEEEIPIEEELKEIAEEEIKKEEKRKEKIDLEKEVIDAIEKNDTPKGASWEKIVAELKSKGIDEMTVEETINILMDKGIIYEPVLGRLKKI